MAKTNRVDFQIKEVLKHNRDGTPGEQTKRHNALMKGMQLLQDRGYGQRWDIHKIGSKEIHRLVNDWRENGNSNATIKNKLVHFRWLASKLGRAELIPENKDLSLGLKKNNVSHNINKAVALDPRQLKQLGAREQLITRLRASFGLRTEEALKFQYAYATKAQNQIELKGSWTKGGRPRAISITNNEQRELLRKVGEFQRNHGDKSMIPNGKTYTSYRREYDDIRARHGIAGHGLRHQWAQDRFKQVSGGIKAPFADGPKYKDLNSEEQARWDRAASVVNHELGHGVGRKDITAAYIGKN